MTGATLERKSSRAEEKADLKRLPFLDGLRALAILCVMGVHCRGPVAQFFTGFSGWVGVDAFFVISGFLITTILLREQTNKGTVSLKNFYIRRALRLMPVYLAWIALTAIINPKHCLDLPAAVGIAVVYMADYDLAMVWNHIYKSGLDIAWSLSVEEKFYLLWPTIIKRLKTALAFSTVAAIVACFAWRAYLLCHGAYWVRIAYAFDTKVDAILIGCLAATAIANPKTRTILQKLFGHPLIPSCLFVFVCVYVKYIGQQMDARTLTENIIFWDMKVPVFYFACAALVTALYLRSASLPSRILSMPPLVWLGKISYSVYLWHMFAFRLVAAAPFLQGHANTAAIELLKYSLAIVFAAISYYGLEKPFLDLKERLSKKNAHR